MKLSSPRSTLHAASRFLARCVFATVMAASLPAAAAVTVSAPTVSVPHGTSITVPISLGGITSEQIVSVEVFLSFDTSVLTYTGVDVTGHLTEPWAGFLESNLVDGGVVDTLKIAAATVNDPINVSGILFELNFDVADLRDPAFSSLTLEVASVNEALPAGGVTHGTATVVGVDGTIAVTPNPVELEQTVLIAVTDADEDRTGAADSVPVTVINGADVETLSAVETGTATGLFEVTIPVSFAVTANPGDLIVQAEVGDDISVCYDDLLDAAGATVPRCDIVAVVGNTDGIVDATIVAAPGDTVHVRLEDLDLNTDPSSVESGSVTVVHFFTAEEETILLQETGPDTDIFIGRFYTVFGSTAGAVGDTIINIQKADSLLVRYDDALTAAGPPASFVDTTAIVDPFGDASANGSVRALDAFLVLEHWVGNITLAGLDSMASNLDLQAPFSAIDDADATLILQLRVGLIDRFPIQGPDSDNHPQPETANSAPKRIPEVRMMTLVRATDEGYIALQADNVEGILSAQFELATGFDGRVELGASAKGFLLAVGRRNGNTRIALAGSLPMHGYGELLRFYPTDGRAPQLRSVRFNGGEMVGNVSAESAPTVVPVQFRLQPNIPNPFNPTTVIPYQVDRTEHVRLEVFNEIGQLVRTLHEGPLTTGSYRVVWNGQDNTGAAVAGGTYFYRLLTPTRTDVRKMTLLK